MEQGANPNIKNNKGRYPLELFLDLAADAAVKKLIEKYHANIALTFDIPANYQIDSQRIESKI